MKFLRHIIVFFAAAIAMFGSVSDAATGKLPKVGGREVVAKVNGEPIFLAELKEAMATMHGDLGGDVTEKATEKKGDPSVLLDRLINVTLILEEARNIGLDTLPEAREPVEKFAAAALREQLLLRRLHDVKADGNEVERIYRQYAKEVEVKSVLFGKKADADAARKELDAGAAYDNVVKRFVEEGKAKSNQVSSAIKYTELHPAIAEEMSGLKPGQSSSVIKFGKEYGIFQFDEIRYPDNPEARERAKKEALTKKRLDTIYEYVEQLSKKYAKVRKAILESLDFDGRNPAVEKVLEDPRVVADIKGGKPITVGDVARAVKEKYFHGTELAAERKKLNRARDEIFQDILGKRLLGKEAVRLGLDKSKAYRQKVERFRKEILFGVFVSKVVEPDIKVDSGEAKYYYEEHKDSFATPGMIVIQALGFRERGDAEEALDKLRKGVEFRWVRENTEGQIDTGKGDIPKFVGSPVEANELPEGLRKAVAGAVAGDARFYASPEGIYFVIFVEEVIPSTVKPYEVVRENIAQALANEKRKSSIEDWVGKLRAAAEIKIYGTGQVLAEELRK